MSYEIHITKAAERDLENALDYIELVLFNPQAADDLMDEMEKNVANLSQLPKKHALVDDPVLKAWGIRFVTVKKYLIFYTISEQEKRVHIVRFLYGKRNWISMLKQNFLLE